MEKIKEIPEGIIHKFGENQYVIKRNVPLKNSGGIKRQKENIELLYVFEFNEDGKIDNCTFGRLVDKRQPNSINNKFMLVTYGSEEPVEFEMTIPLLTTGFKETYHVAGEIGKYLANPEKYMEKTGGKVHY